MYHFVAAVGRRRNPIHFLLTTTIINPSLFLSRTHHLFFRSLHHKPIKEEEGEPTEKNHASSLTTVTYLINSCGLSPQSALSASQRINVKTTIKPDYNLSLLKSHGFSDTQITKLISSQPRILLANWDKSIRPKLDYFLSLGYSETGLTTLVSSNPDLMISSLQRKIKHNYDLLRSIFSTSQQMVDAVRRSSAWLLTTKLETNFLPNVRTLQSYGVPATSIARLAAMHPRMLMQTTAGCFKTTIESLRKMGFNPLSTMFVHGISAMSGMKPSTWERKVAFCKSMGWSEAEFISAFRKHPLFMSHSEEKINRMMGFFAEKMNWGPSFLAAHPVLLTLSLEKRIIPRSSVLRVLESKGLVKKSATVQFLIINESDFLSKYIIKYQDQVPGLLQAYEGSLET